MEKYISPYADKLINIDFPHLYTLENDELKAMKMNFSFF